MWLRACGIAFRYVRNQPAISAENIVIPVCGEYIVLGCDIV